MSLAADLLQQTEDLLNLDPRRPKQASLRRSISTAYYSLFSLLVDEAARAAVGGGPGKKLLRGYVIRTFYHKGMADVCRRFVNKNHSKKIEELLPGHQISEDLVYIADTFCFLQDERTEADYNFVRSYTKEYVNVIISDAKIVHEKYQAIKNREETKIFLMALLVNWKWR